MAKPEQFGINVKNLVDALANDQGISVDTPHFVTPGTAKLLAERAVRSAFALVQPSIAPNQASINDIDTLKEHAETKQPIAPLLSIVPRLPESEIQLNEVVEQVLRITNQGDN